MWSCLCIHFSLEELHLQNAAVDVRNCIKDFKKAPSFYCLANNFVNDFHIVIWNTHHFKLTTDNLQEIISILLMKLYVIGMQNCSSSTVTDLGYFHIGKLTNLRVVTLLCFMKVNITVFFQIYFFSYVFQDFVFIFQIQPLHWSDEYAYQQIS